MNRMKALQGLKAVAVIVSPALAAVSCGTGDQPEMKPNIIYILADDLGYGELGVYGQTRIETPNIDMLARSGVLFTQHYTGAPVSAPARCVLLTGLHSGHAQVRGNDEWAERGDVWNYRAMIADSTLEGQKPLAAGTVTIGTLLQEAGYRTALIGKWGLGAPHTESIPNKMGFDLFFGYNCQRMAHTLYPVHLYRNESRFHLNNDTIAPHTKFNAGDDPYDIENYSDFSLNDYAPELMFREIEGFVKENKNNPFFLYWATPIPHVPLQAPDEWVQKYVEKFGSEEPYVTGNYFPNRYPRATYAAMISYLDYNVGRLVELLKELGLYENTIIVFTSDNGPSYAGGTDTPWFESAAPFRSETGFTKGQLSEGGIRVPMIASWPAEIKPGTTSGHQSSFQDVLPTLCEIAGIEVPEVTDGISFLPELRGKKQKAHDYLYWEFPESGGQQAVRIGNMKAIRKNMHKGNTQFELYDIVNDPEEKNNIAADNPDIIEKVLDICSREHTMSANPRWRYTVIDSI
jgi:arylsulfatase A-like enzyme